VLSGRRCRRVSLRIGCLRGSSAGAQTLRFVRSFDMLEYREIGKWLWSPSPVKQPDFRRLSGGGFWTDSLSKHSQFPIGTFVLTRKGKYGHNDSLAEPRCVEAANTPS